MRYPLNIRLILLPLLALCGCLHGTAPQEFTSCNGFGRPYSFATNGQFLIAGPLLYSISDPTHPIRSIQNFSKSGQDSVAFDSSRIYTFNGAMFVMDTIGNNAYASGFMFQGYARHVALANNLFYVLRHTTYPRGNIYCYEPSDTVNALEVQQFSVISHLTTTLAQIPLTDPTGIAVRANTLYVLDGSTGLHVYTLSNPKQPQEIAHLTSVQGYHLQVTQQSTLLVTSSNGISQYDISNPASVTLLSRIQ